MAAFARPRASAFGLRTSVAIELLLFEVFATRKRVSIRVRIIQQRQNQWLQVCLRHLFWLTTILHADADGQPTKRSLGELLSPPNLWVPARPALRFSLQSARLPGPRKWIRESKSPKDRAVPARSS